MRLILTRTPDKNRVLDQDNSFIFDQQGGSIGRTQDNDCVLPDPDLYISRKHAVITYHGGVYYLTDTSENGVFLNHSNEPLGKNKTIELHEGDCLSLGEYELSVSMEQPNQEGSSRRRHADSEATSLGPPSSLWETPQSQEPTPDILDGRSHYPEGSSYILSNRNKSAKKSSRPLATEPDHSPADKDFFIPPSIMQEAPSEFSERVVPASRTAENPSTADWDHTEINIPGVHDKQKPDWDTTQFNPVPDAVQEGGTKFTSEQIEIDNDKNSNEPSQLSNEISREAISTGTPIQSELSIGEVDLLQSFFEGIGLKSTQISPEDALLLMKRIGSLNRVIVQGMIEVLIARFDLKNEFRMRHTQLRLKENNPLKFSGHVDDVLEYLFVKQARGFLPPEDAFQEAFQDLKDHQFAMVAGMRAAFESLLQRFDPEVLEKRFLKARKMTNFLAVRRQAVCWERFAEWYEDITADPEDDFQNLFGDAFSQAYEEQVAKLSLSRKKQNN